MTVSRRMNTNPVTCTLGQGVFEAAEIMKAEGVHRLLVLDESDNLVGIVSEKNITNAAADGRMSLVQLAASLSKLKVEDVMSREVITIYPDAPVEQAARKMCDFDIAILPVVGYDGRLVGIVTRSDMFRLLLELFGTRHYGIRVSFTVEDKPGTIAALSSKLDSIGANIISIGNIDDVNGDSNLIMKVSGVEKEALEAAIRPMVKKIIDIREV